MRNTFLFFLFIFIVTAVYPQKHQIYISNDSIDFSDRKAILVMHGLEGNNGSRKKIRKSFENQGYDVLVPDFIDGKSFDGCLKNFESFVEEYELKNYAELNVVCLIMGGYVFNTYLNSNPDFNVNSIVFDRSPIQERAAKVVSTKIPLITKIIVGNVVDEIADYQFITVEKEANIAFIIEFKANYFMRIFKKKTLSMGPLDYEPNNMNQRFDDFMYVPYSHTEMYTNMNNMSEEILFFFKNGVFSPDVKKTPYTQDPFKRRVKPEN